MAFGDNPVSRANESPQAAPRLDAEHLSRAITDFSVQALASRERSGTGETVAQLFQNQKNGDKPQEDKICAMGMIVPPGQKIEITGKDCEFKLVPMTPADEEADRKLREYQQSPEYKRDMEEILKHVQG